MLASLTYFYPHILTLAFVVLLYVTPMRAKGNFFLRALAPLVIAIVLAHLNRCFDFWPAHHYFASGHLTFCLGATYSIARLRLSSLILTLPLLGLEGTGLVAFHFHFLTDVLGAIPIVLAVYCVAEHTWPVGSTLSGECQPSCSPSAP